MEWNFVCGRGKAVDNKIGLWVPTARRRFVELDLRLRPWSERIFMIQTHMTVEERMELLNKALGLPQGFTVCEIGSYLGASTYVLGAAACINKGRIFAIDTWDNEAMGAEAKVDTFSEFLNNIYEFRDVIQPIRGWSRDVADRIPDGLDMVFIDGDHSYEAVLSDLLLYIPKLRRGGLIVMHDYTFDSVKAAAERAWNTYPIVGWGPQVHSLQGFILTDEIRM